MTTPEPECQSTTDRGHHVPAFHVMVKPRGPVCNLHCGYCYYLEKAQLYPGGQFRMTDQVLEAFTQQYIAAQQVPEVTFAWQGGEPTLMGVEFYQRAVELQKQYRRPEISVQNSFQTNAILINDKWSRFFARHGFLIGVSLDGPVPLHDRYRRDREGRASHRKVMRGVSRLKDHQVEFNILACVHAANVERPLEVYQFLRDEVSAKFIQFIPIVKQRSDQGHPSGDGVTPHSITGPQYGEFLIQIFDEWVRHDVGQVFVQIFDSALAAWVGQQPGLCIFEETCGLAMVLEYNGDLYACDHFVEPQCRLGNIMETPLTDLVSLEQQRQFGLAKRDQLPTTCRECPVRFVCNGGCPKNRFACTPAGEPGLNHLCEGYRLFFTHIDEPMRFMANELRNSRAPANVMHVLQSKQTSGAR